MLEGEKIQETDQLMISMFSDVAQMENQTYGAKSIQSVQNQNILINQIAPKVTLGVAGSN